MREASPPSDGGTFRDLWAARRAAARADAAAAAMVAGPWGHGRIKHIRPHAVATAAALPMTHRALLLYVRGLAIGEPAVLQVWALAQLTGRPEAAVLRGAETLAASSTSAGARIPPSA